MSAAKPGSEGVCAAFCAACIEGQGFPRGFREGSIPIHRVATFGLPANDDNKAGPLIVKSQSCCVGNATLATPRQRMPGRTGRAASERRPLPGPSTPFLYGHNHDLHGLDERRIPFLIPVLAEEIAVADPIRPACTHEARPVANLVILGLFAAESDGESE